MQNKRSGFIQLILLILIALFLMKYFGVTVSGVIDWFMKTFENVLK
ncbi:MAG: hypothetical protein KBC06_01595 [Candidatus Pacebacteria bacterium]|nr:hypothetical protein [Candidatus Paceibacterota bacterium]